MRCHTGRCRIDPILAPDQLVLPDLGDMRIWTQGSLDKVFIHHFQLQMVFLGVNMLEYKEIDHLPFRILWKPFNQIKQGMLPER